MHRIIRVTAEDYRIYRNLYIGIRYSIFPKGKGPDLNNKLEKVMKDNLRGKGEFLNAIEETNRELYFLEIDGTIKGFCELVFHEPEKFCNIFEFATTEHYKGYGTLLYNEIKKVVKDRGIKRLVLYCPFNGAKVFWLKLGFSSLPKCIFEKKI